jgi:hypothetical protein
VSVKDQEQGERDQRMLKELIRGSEEDRAAPWREPYLKESEQQAFEDMLDTLEAGRFPSLTARQRKWANDVAERLGVEPSEGPEDDGAPKDTRFTDGPVPRGREVRSLVKGLAKCPPGRR